MVRFVTVFWAVFRKDIVIRKFRRGRLHTLMLITVAIGLLEMLRHLNLTFHDNLHERDKDMNMDVDIDKEDRDEVIPKIDGVTFGPYDGLHELHDNALIYLPKTRYSEKVIQGSFHGRDIKGLRSHEDFEKYPKKNDRHSQVFGIYFPEEPSATHLRYTLRSLSKFTLGLPMDYSSELLPLMTRLFREHVHYFKPGARVPPQVLQQFPKGKQRAPSVKQLKNELASICILVLGSLGYMIFFIDFCNKTIQDKESRFKELLKLMGMSDTVYWLSLLCVGLSVGAPLCFISSVQICLSMDKIAFLRHTSFLIVFLILLFFVIGTMLVILFLSVIFQSARTGSIALVIYLFVSQFLFQHWFGLSKDCLGASADDMLMSSLIPTHAFTWAVKLMYAYEAANTGAHIHNMFEAPPGPANMSLFSIFVAQLVSWAIWGCIILYIDAVNPWQLGIPKSPLFCIECLCCQAKQTFQGVVGLQKSNTARIESMPPEAGPPVIRVVGVTHSFGEFKAIDNLSLELYRNQISVLLGHNGAGKTTIMNIMTGLFPPDKGDIFIDGYSIRRATAKARENIGLCPQHNVLFEYLTVEEHLEFFAALKGAKLSSIGVEIDNVLGKIGLIHKKTEFPTKLSGGMKRKLCLANATIGGSKILILDEPSSGLDPESRRSVWDFLKKERETRTILITTHHMEEADVLGDRVLLLARGRLMCAGSPMFLKKIFETGYKIRVAKESTQVDSGAIFSAVKDALGEASGEKTSVISDMGLEIVMNIGFPSSEDMIKLFKKLESDMKDLKITNIGASVTTMEDVFIKVGEIDDAEAAEAAFGPKGNVQVARAISEKLVRCEVMTGVSGLFRKIEGLWWKRFHAFKREWKFILYLILWPVLFTSFFISLINSANGSERELRLSMRSLFGRTYGFLAGEQTRLSKAAKESFMQEGVHFREHINYKEAWDRDKQIRAYLLKIRDEQEMNYFNKWSVGLTGEQLWVSGTKQYMSVAALVGWQRALLSELMGRDSRVDVSVWPYTGKMSSPPRFQVATIRFVAAGLISAALAMMSGPSVSYPVSEKKTKFKLLQLMTGVHPVIFHGANLLFDFTVQALVAALLLGMFRYRNPAGCFSYSSDTFNSLCALFFTYAAAMIPLAYLASFLYSESGSAQTIFISFNIVPPAMAGAVLSIYEAIHYYVKDPEFLEFRTFIDLASWHPTFAVMWGTSSIILNGLSNSICSFVNTEYHAAGCKEYPMTPCCAPCHSNNTFSGQNLCYKYESSLAMDSRFGAGIQMSRLVNIGVVCSILVILADCNIKCIFNLLERTTSRPAKDSEADPSNESVTIERTFFDELTPDEDVAREQLAVESIVSTGRTAFFPLVAQKLYKRYGNLTAVNNVSFHLDGNECFGLLGVNGAGKTSVFSMLTGDIPMTDGDAFIRGINISSSPSDYRREIGYCPQFDPLHATATGREHLELFCALRGISKSDSKDVIRILIEATGTALHIDKQIQNCSGGNKRKISLAVSLVGFPALLFLDEPTAGVDPTARKKIYATLSQAQKDLNTAMVLTSHALEVCESLCSRVAIMVGGSFRCLGPTQALKSKFGSGYTIQIKLKEISEKTKSDLLEVMSNIFGSTCFLKQIHMTQLQFHVDDTSLKWSEIFEKVQKLREHTEFTFEDIQVSDVTLDELFLKFGKA